MRLFLWNFGEKCVRINTFLDLDIFEIDLYPYRMNFDYERLSNEVRKRPPETFLPFFW